MNKIKLSLIIGISTLLLNQSCQQPEADQASIDAKVTEAYSAKKTEIENNAATACEDAINAKVKSIQDSMATMNASQQAAAMAKAQKNLKLAQAKASQAAKAKKPAKPAMSENEGIIKAQQDLLKNKGEANVQKTDAEIKKAQQELLKTKGEANVQKTDDEVKKAQQELLKKLQGGGN
jgi:hypothetical protein